MITPSHLIYSWALGKATEETANLRRLQLFVLGGFLPDLPVYIFFVTHGLILGTPGPEMWNDMYFSSAWTPFFTLSHSLILWPLALLLSYAFKHAWLRYVATAGIVHVVLDSLVHHDDAYRHFWPLTNWKFESPLSYWDPAHFGNYVGAADAAVILLLLAWLFTTIGTGSRHKTYLQRLVYVLGAAYLAIFIMSLIQIF